MLLTIENVACQSLTQHRWQNRLILILFKSSEAPERKKQLQWLEANVPGLTERKIKVYQVTTGYFYEGLNDGNRIKDRSVYRNYSNHKDDFEILLIGLDGGEKFRSPEVISTNIIFQRIDSMPMRKEEIKQAQGKNN